MLLCNYNNYLLLKTSPNHVSFLYEQVPLDGCARFHFKSLKGVARPDYAAPVGVVSGKGNKNGF